MEAVRTGSLRVSSLFNVAGRVALITGGGRGVGEMIARAYVENGVKVYITSRSAPTLARTAAALTALGPGTCHALPAADLSTGEGCSALIKHLETLEPALDILVNNSGISWGAPFDTFPEKEFDRVMALNVKTPFLMTRGCRRLLEAGANRAVAGASESAAGAADPSLPPLPSTIVNIGSIVGLRPQPVPTYSYDPSKAALHALTTKLSSELAPLITVNALALGYIPSRMSRGLLTYGSGEALRAAIPMQRFGGGGDVGGAALFLASRAGSWCTGTVLTVDGGSVAQPLQLLDPTVMEE